LAVGNAEQIGIYQAQTEKLGIAQRVQFLGAMDSVDEVYQAADALVHPTLEDTFAMVVLEAMSYGLPVVVSCEKYCGIAGLLTNGLNALILEEPKNAVALAERLRQLTNSAVDSVDNSKDLREKLGSEALKFASSYAWTQIARQQLFLYEKIIKK
jgi:glycosyltransferase involved in cell wall biosynthesis